MKDLIGHMHDAAQQACNYVEGMALDELVQDRRTQQAIIFTKWERPHLPLTACLHR